MDSILELFERAASSEDDGGDHLGSLITNAAVELAPHDARVRAVVAEHFADIEAGLKRAIERAQELGDVSRQKDAIKIARGLLALLQGLLVLARSGARGHSGRQAAAVVLDADGDGVCPEHFLG
jgi:TetR/AcrR family transcriptional repressor of nem operon